MQRSEILIIDGPAQKVSIMVGIVTMISTNKSTVSRPMRVLHSATRLDKLRTEQTRFQLKEEVTCLQVSGGYLVMGLGSGARSEILNIMNAPG